MPVAIVSGANRGLGLELVQQLLQRDWRVIAACRRTREKRLTELAGSHPGHLHVMPLDVTSERSIAAFAGEATLVTDRVDLLVNNAGVLIPGERFGEVTAKSLTESFAANAAGALLLTQACVGLLRGADGARVVNVSTVMASIAATEAFRTPSYAISKAALNMATRLLAAELSPQGICVAAFHPGWVQTDMGGAGAPLTVQDSAEGMMARFDELTLAHTGAFLNWRGGEYAW